MIENSQNTMNSQLSEPDVDLMFMSAMTGNTNTTTSQSPLPLAPPLIMTKSDLTSTSDNSTGLGLFDDKFDSTLLLPPPPPPTNLEVLVSSSSTTTTTTANDIPLMTVVAAATTTAAEANGSIDRADTNNNIVSASSSSSESVSSSSMSSPFDTVNNTVNNPLMFASTDMVGNIDVETSNGPLVIEAAANDCNENEDDEIISTIQRDHIDFRMHDRFVHGFFSHFLI